MNTMLCEALLVIILHGSHKINSIQNDRFSLLIFQDDFPNFFCFPFLFNVSLYHFRFPIAKKEHAIIDLTVCSRRAVAGVEGMEDEDANDMVILGSNERHINVVSDETQSVSNVLTTTRSPAAFSIVLEIS